MQAMDFDAGLYEPFSAHANAVSLSLEASQHV